MIAALLLAVLAGTTNPSAQAAFDRGLLLLYSYNGAAARDEFAQALQDDPHLAIAAWGEALASGTDLNTPLTPQSFSAAQVAARQAQSLERFATPEQRGLIDAVASRYSGTFENRGAADQQYRAAMSTLIAQYPNDDDVLMLDAEALMEVRITDPQARDLIERVLARNPNHVMANHLCMHAYDYTPDHAAALPCANRVASWNLDPQQAHLAHMPAHTYIENGLYAKALAVSERAWHLREQLADPKYRMHDAYTGWSAAMMLGDLHQAEMWAQRTGAAYGGSDRWATWMRFDQWALIAGSPSTDEFYAPLARGLTDVHYHVLSDARAMLALYGRQDTDYRWLLEAAIDEAGGRIDDAASALERAIAYQSKEDDGEQLPLFPAGEYLGALYFRHKEYAQAKDAYTATLARYPNDPRALYGLGLTEKALGEAVSSTRALNMFATLWTSAAPPDIEHL